MAQTHRALDLRLLLPALIAWGVAAALLGAATSLVIAVLVGCLVTGIGCCGMGRPTVRMIGFCALATTFILTAVLGHRAVAQAGLVPTLAERGASVRLEARVVSDPAPVRSRFGGEQVWRVRLQATRISGRGEVAGARTPILAFGGQDVGRLRWHDTVVAAGRLQPAETGADVRAILRIRQVQRTQPAGRIEETVEHLRTGLRDSTEGLPTDPAGLVPALVIGDTSRMPQELNDDMQATGMTHLNAVSGSNVTVVLMCVQGLAGYLRIPRRWRLPFALLGLALFVMLCRPEPSVVRASAMGLVGLLALRGGSRRAGAPALAGAILVLLAIDPHLARSFGFILSSFATLGLLLFARPWADAIARYLPRRCAPLAEAICVPLAAQVFCAPLTLLLQPGVSLVGVPANVLAAPLVPIATVAGVLVVCSAPVLQPLAQLLAWVAGLPAWGIATIAHLGADLPYGTLPWPGGWAGLALLVLVIALVLTTGHWWAHQAAARPWHGAAAAVTALALVVPVPAAPPSRGWTVAMCDVGQGDATIVRSPQGGVLLIDTGPEPDTVDSCLSRLGVERIDAVVLTHFHADHVDGLAGVLRSGRTVRELVATFVEGEDDAGPHEEASRREPTLALAARARLPVRLVRRGDSVDAPGITGKVLWPARTLETGSVQNNASVVLAVVAGGVRALFTGDIERDAGRAVRQELQATGEGSFDVLKVAHHGSANQDADLMAVVRPRVCLIGVGADNDYGHPAPATLRLLAGCTVLRTDQDGMLFVHPHTDGGVSVSSSG